MLYIQTAYCDKQGDCKYRISHLYMLVIHLENICGHFLRQLLFPGSLGFLHCIKLFHPMVRTHLQSPCLQLGEPVFSRYCTVTVRICPSVCWGEGKIREISLPVTFYSIKEKKNTECRGGFPLLVSAQNVLCLKQANNCLSLIINRLVAKHRISLILLDIDECTLPL